MKASSKLAAFLQHTSVICGLSVPDLFNYNGIAVLYIIYSFIVCLFLACLCIYSTYFKISSGLLVDCVPIIGFTLTNIICIVSIVLVNRRKNVQIIRNVTKITKKLCEDINSLYDSDTVFILQLVCIESLSFAYIIYDFSLTALRENDLFHSSVQFIRYVNLFMTSLTFVQILQISKLIHRLLTSANKSLLETASTTEINFFLKLYDNICDTATLVSKVYGLQIVCIHFLTLFCVLRLSHDFVFTEKGNNVLFADVCYCLVHLICCSLLLVRQSRINHEIACAAIICCKILQECEPGTNFRTQILILAEILSERKVDFSNKHQTE